MGVTLNAVSQPAEDDTDTLEGWASVRQVLGTVGNQEISDKCGQ